MATIIYNLSRNIKQMMWINTLCLTVGIPLITILFTGKDLRTSLLIACVGVLLGAWNHLFFNNYRLRKAGMEIMSSYEKVQNDLFFDELTGVYNRRAGMERLREEFSRSQRNGKQFTVAMADIDHFKKINDTYGHLAGDHVLRIIGKTLRKELRRCDVVVRYGGEEFMVIMPETDKNRALHPLDRLRWKLSCMDIPYEDSKIRVSISIGVASSFPVTQDVSGVIHLADKALYSAKESGRNCVVLDEHPAKIGFLSVN